MSDSKWHLYFALLSHDVVMGGWKGVLPPEEMLMFPISFLFVSCLELSGLFRFEKSPSLRRVREDASRLRVRTDAPSIRGPGLGWITCFPFREWWVSEAWISGFLLPGTSMVCVGEDKEGTMSVSEAEDVPTTRGEHGLAAINPVASSSPHGGTIQSITSSLG